MTFWHWILKLFKGPRKPTAEKSTSEKPAKKASDFCHGEYFLQESTVFKAPTKWLLKGPYLYASFQFPAIRFDAPMLLSFSGCTHAHAKCPPVHLKSLTNKHCQCCHLCRSILKHVQASESLKKREKRK